MGCVIVIAMYKPHEGRESALLELVGGHVSTLQELGLATSRAPIVAKSSDGTLLEVFEWSSEEAAQAAHQHPTVGRIWEQIGMVAGISTLSAIPESAQPFAHFEPVDF